jgi:hypothetical protein
VSADTNNAAVAEDLMVGTVGWQHEQWVGSYYPPELPEDWRFGYYSNDFRAVLVPADHWSPAGSTPVGDWAADSDGGFRFVVELPSTCARPGPGAAAALEDFFSELAPVAPQLAGWTLVPAADATPDGDWLVHTIERLMARAPVCVHLEGKWHSDHLLDLVSRTDAGLLWNVDATPGIDAVSGRFALAISSATEPRAQRPVIERLGKFLRGGGRAGLFFRGASAPQAAKNARLLAEMLGI